MEAVEGNEVEARQEEGEGGIFQRAAFERKPMKRGTLLLIKGSTRAEESTPWRF